MDSPREDIDLTADLRALRPTPRAEFIAELDARADAGFPRPPRHGGAAIDRLVERVHRTPRWRLPALAGAAAAVAIVAATAFVALSESDRDTIALRPERPAVVEAGAEPRGVELQRLGDARSRTESSAASAAGSSEYSAAVPANSGPYASRGRRRDIERSARIVLGTEASEVRSAAAKVFGAVRSYDGIVMRSSVRDGNAGTAGAIFELLVPSQKLGEAMAAFSEIADVRSRSESTLDVTAPTIGVEQRLRDARATVEGLLAQLAEADTDAERASVEAELRAERRRLAALRSRLTALQQRTHLSPVSLRIETGATAASDVGGHWGVDDAVEEAGRIFSIAAGVTVIGTAILGPLALLAMLFWFARRTWVRTQRERALG